MDTAHYHGDAIIEQLEIGQISIQGNPVFKNKVEHIAGGGQGQLLQCLLICRREDDIHHCRLFFPQCLYPAVRKANILFHRPGLSFYANGKIQPSKGWISKGWITIGWITII